MAREFQSIQVKYWECAQKKKLTMQEIAVEFFLMTYRDCGPSGLLICSTSTIGWYTGSSDRQVTPTLTSLEKKERIKRAEGDWVFVLGKWEHERTKSAQVHKCVARELETAPDALKQCWFDTYTDPHIEGLLTFTRESLGGQVTHPPIVEKSRVEEESRNTMKVLHGKKVKLTEKEYQRLCTDFTTSVIDNKIRDMNEWIGMTVGHKGFADYNLALRKWLRKDGILLGGAKVDDETYHYVCLSCGKWYERADYENKDFICTHEGCTHPSEGLVKQ